MFSIRGSFSFKKSTSYFWGLVPGCLFPVLLFIPYVLHEITHSHPSLFLFFLLVSENSRTFVSPNSISRNMLSLLETLAYLSLRPPRPRLSSRTCLFLSVPLKAGPNFSRHCDVTGEYLQTGRSFLLSLSLSCVTCASSTSGR